MKYKKSLISFATFILLIFAGLLYRDQLATFVIKQYLGQYDLKAEFKIESFSFSGLKLSEVNIPGLVVASAADIDLDGTELKTIELEVEELDFYGLLQLLSKLDSSTSVESDAVDYSSLSNICPTLKPMNLGIQLKSIRLGEKSYPLEFQVKKIAEANQTQTKFKLNVSEHTSEKLSFSQFDVDSGFQLNCEKDHLLLVIEQLQLQAKNLSWGDEAKSLLSLEVKEARGQIEVDEQSKLRTKLQLAPQVEWRKGKGAVAGTVDRLSFTAESNLNNLASGTYKVSGHQVALSSPYQVTAADISLQADSLDFSNSSMVGKYSIEEFGFISEKDKPLVSGVHSTGGFSLDDNQVKVDFALTDQTKSLQNFEGKILYKIATSRLSLSFPKLTKALKVNDQWNQLFPGLDLGPIEGEGTLSLGGTLHLFDKVSQRPFELKVDAQEFESEYGELQNILWKHDIVNYQTLASTPRQHLVVKKYIYGPTIEDISMVYQVVSLKKVIVEDLRFVIDGVNVTASSFVINPQQKRLQDFRAQVSHLFLEKLLKLALAGTVTASGELKGHININFEGKVPVLSGRLEALAPGWIRYRKPGAPPFDPNLISGNPMTILENYLYDFYFESLKIDLQSDRDYNLTMTLRALGKNPQYLAGKPLKLNVNLEQNLLAGFKALMLTYDMPSRLKNKLEKLGSK